MLGALGCVVPELLDQTNHVPWFKAGAQIFAPEGIQYLGVDGLINARSIVATLLVQVGGKESERRGGGGGAAKVSSHVVLALEAGADDSYRSMSYHLPLAVPWHVEA